MSIKQLLICITIASGVMLHANVTLQLSDGSMVITDKQFAMLKEISPVLQSLMAETSDEDTSALDFSESPITKKAIAQIINVLTAQDIEGHLRELSDADLVTMIKSADYFGCKLLLNAVIDVFANRLTDLSLVQKFAENTRYLHQLKFGLGVLPMLAKAVRKTDAYLKVLNAISIPTHEIQRSESSEHSNKQYPVAALAWSPDDRLIVSSQPKVGGDYVPGPDTKMIRIWDVNDPKPFVRYLVPGRYGAVHQIFWAPDGTIVAPLYYVINAWSPDGKPTKTFEMGFPGGMTRCALNDQGTKLAYVSLSSPLAIWDMQSSQMEKAIVYPDQNSGCTSIAWNHQGTKIALSARDGEVIVLDVGSGDMLHQLYLKKIGRTKVDSLFWSPDDNYLVTVSYGGLIAIFDATTGQLVKEFEDGYGAIASLSPDGTLLAVGRYGVITIWDLRLGKKLNVLNEEGVTTSLAWNHTGTQLVSGTAKQRIKIWDMMPLIDAMNESHLERLLAAIALANDEKLQLNSQQIKRLKMLMLKE